MNAMNAGQAQGVLPLTQSDVAPLVSAIGNGRFGQTLAQFLHTLCGASHFAAFRLGEGQMSRIAACCVQPERTAVKEVTRYIEGGMWKCDPAVHEAQRRMKESSSSVIHIDLNSRDYFDLRPHLWPQVNDRMMLCVRDDSGAFGLAVLRMHNQPPFEQDVGEKLGDQADLLLALLSKHAEVSDSRPNIADALIALRDIEACVDVMGQLPRRETEVCSRVLYGMSSAGISIDLSISEETVKTYRKRVYLRLGIGSERELLRWYLECWSRWRFRTGRAGSYDARTV